MSWSAFLGGLLFAAVGYAVLGFREAIFSLSCLINPFHLMRDNRWFYMPLLVISALLAIVIGIGFMVAALLHAFFSMG